MLSLELGVGGERFRFCTGSAVPPEAAELVDRAIHLLDELTQRFGALEERLLDEQSQRERAEQEKAQAEQRVRELDRLSQR